MKDRFFKFIATVAILIICFCDVGAQNIRAEAKLQQYTISIGDQTKLFLSVHQVEGQHFSFPKLTDTITGKVTLVSANKPDTIRDQNDKKNFIVTRSYTITSFDPGTYTIPAFSVGYEKGVVKTNELTLQVETVKVDTTKGIYDIKQPIAVSYSFFDWLRDHWLWIAVPPIGIALAVALFLYLRNRPKTVTEVKTIARELPPGVVALDKLKILNGKKLWQQGEVKLYYIELSDIIREYLEKRYTIKTHERTTDELFTILRHVAIADENREKLRQLLVLADLVKFAKEQPLPFENEEKMQMAVDFVVKTQPMEVLTTVADGGRNA